MGMYPTQFFLSRVSLSLDTVVVGEVDQLEGVIEVEGWELEEELVDKPSCFRISAWQSARTLYVGPRES